MDDEAKRLEELCKYENEFYEMGYHYIAGIDEVGRGPLAGPVLACAVILPREFRLPGINDSKKLSQKKREALAAQIHENALAIGIGFADETIIDEINILQATFNAMRMAIARLSIKPEAALIDGVSIPDLDASIIQKRIVGGDGLSQSIAAASIVAKVMRDDMMKKYHEEYPVYGFDTHKGYGTAKHIEAIHHHGLCPIHRRSFCGSFV